MLRMPPLLESRNSLLHLWASLERKWIQATSSPMAIGCSLNPEPCHQEGAISWCSSWENWRTEGALHSPWCKKEKRWIKRVFLRNSRLLSERFTISWRATRSWSDWSKMYRDGRVGAERISPIAHHPRSLKDFRKTGLSLWTHVAQMHWWNSDRTSAKH